MLCPASLGPAVWPAQHSELLSPASSVPSLVFRAHQALAGRVRAGSSHLSPQIPINENLIYSFVTTGVGRMPEMKCLPAVVLHILSHKQCQRPGHLVIFLCLTISLGFVFYLQSFTENKKAKCVSYMAWCTPEPLLQCLLMCFSGHCCAHTPAVTTV